MEKYLLYISEEHIGRNASPSDAQRIIELLQANGWTAVYGDDPWKFSDETQRASFEKAFEWALAVVTAEKQPHEEITWIGLARQRIQFNDQLRNYEKQLVEKYWIWLVEASTHVILNWLETKKDAAKG